MTAQEIITRHIAERAKRRLAESTDDISIVAYELGFQHPQHFSRMFKRIIGISSTQFREKATAISNN
ncbi:MAG: AraC family transcriptional regulator [Bacteroidales bacterium]|nr:AraC family transcriptional regulator [Bacteroidales bacterium]